MGACKKIPDGNRTTVADAICPPSSAASDDAWAACAASMNDPRHSESKVAARRIAFS